MHAYMPGYAVAGEASSAARSSDTASALGAQRIPEVRNRSEGAARSPQEHSGHGFEREAERVAGTVVAGGAAKVGLRTSGERIQKQDLPEKREQPSKFPVEDPPKTGEAKTDEEKEKLLKGGLKAAGELAKYLWDAFSKSPEGERILRANERDVKPAAQFFEDFAKTVLGKIILGATGAGAAAGMAAGAWGSRDKPGEEPDVSPSTGGPTMRAPKDEKFFALELNWDFVTPPTGFTLKTPWADAPKIGKSSPSTSATPVLTPPPVMFKMSPMIPRICTPADPKGDQGEADARSAEIYAWLRYREQLEQKRVRELLEKYGAKSMGPPKYAPSVLQPMFKRTAGAEPVDDPAAVHEGVGSAAQSLDASTRAQMEARLGHAFGDVRIHAGPAAAQAARALNAEAYTIGRDVVFGAGRYNPASAEGRRLIAHELAHVVQQGSAHSAVGGAATPRLEAEAERTAAKANGSTAGAAPRRAAATGGRGPHPTPRRGEGFDVAEREAASAGERVAAGVPASIRAQVPPTVQRQIDSESGVLRQFPDPSKLTREELLAGIGRIITVLERATGSSTQLGDLELKVLPAYVSSFVNVSKANGDSTVIVGLKPDNPVHRKVLDLLPQPPPALDLTPTPQAPKAAPPAEKKPNAAEVLPTYAVWGPLFLEGMRDALKEDTKLQAGYQKLLLQLSSNQGKAEFGGGMALGLVPGALVAIADIPYSLWKTTVELGLKGATALGEPEVKKRVDELLAAVKKLAVRLPELTAEVANQPKQAGLWAGVLVSARIREDLFLEEAPKGPAKPAPGADAAGKKYNPLDFSGVELPDLYGSARDLITRGGAGEKGSFIFNKGVAGGMAIGYTLMNLAMLFVGPEEMVAKAGSVGAKGLEALKATGLWKRIAAIVESIPELKALATAKRAATEAKAGSTGVKAAEGLGKAADDAAAAGGIGGKPAEAPKAPEPNRASNRVLSHGELQEEPMRKLHHPNAEMLSEKASGFDFAEGAQRVSAHTEQQKGLTIVTERIAGGDWIQLKSIKVESEVVSNVDTAMERAENALKGVPKNQLEKIGEGGGRKVYEFAPEDLKIHRENLFERTKAGQAYRTSYARKPDRITIHLHFENVAATDSAKLQQLETQARQAVQASPHLADLPPVHVYVSGR